MSDGLNCCHGIPNFCQKLTLNDQENALLNSNRRSTSTLQRPLNVLRMATLTAALTLASTAWAAPGVTFLATDLADTTAGEDLWQFDYSITGPLAEFESVNLLFTPSDFSPALAVLTSDISISTTVTAPVASPAADGQVLATAMAPLPSNAFAAMSVQFVWTGAGRPGAQSFEVLDDHYNVLLTGTTMMAAAVPEASTVTMLFAGMILLGSVAYRRRRR